MYIAGQGNHVVMTQ